MPFIVFVKCEKTNDRKTDIFIPKFSMDPMKKLIEHLH